MKEVYDITIIGGGPGGLYSAFYAGLRDLKTKIIEYKPTLGGKLHVYPEKFIWDIGGLPGMQAHKVMENMVEQGLTFQPTVHLNTKVDFVTKQDDVFVIETNAGEKHFSKKVIVTNGGGIINPMKLQVEGAEAYEETNLHYTIQSIHHFKDKSLVISGGGNSAIDWAKELLGVAKQVIVIYRGEKLKAHEAQINYLEQQGVPILTHTSIHSFVGEESRIKEVILENAITKEKTVVAVDDVLVNHGFDRCESFTFDASIAPAQDEEYKYYYLTNGKGLTTVDGIYAVGDVSKHDNKVYLISGAFHDAINAINDIKLSLEPTAEKYAKVSTYNEAFEQRNREIMANMGTEIGCSVVGCGKRNG